MTAASSDNNRKPNVVIVVQRYGLEVNGGAEVHARWLAEHLSDFCTVTVLTTCALDYHTWENHYSAETTTINNITVKRFKVDQPRNWKKAQKQTQKLILTDHTAQDELDWIRDQGPLSQSLLNAIQAHEPTTDHFIFFTFLYATTFFGLPLVAHKAILVPTAHDDPFLKLPLFHPTFNKPSAIVYNTHTEKALVNRYQNNHHVHQIVAGIGINTPPTTNAAAFRQKYNITGRFILYVGRIDYSKNVPELLDYFQQYSNKLRVRADGAEPTQLVLIGKNHLKLPQDARIRALGFVSEQDKFDAIQAADVVIMPSKYESLSMITLESWLTGTPTLVNGDCQVLKDLSRQSNGGLYYTSYDEFELLLSKLLDEQELRVRIGRNGQKFVEKTYAWPIIMQKYSALFTTLNN